MSVSIAGRIFDLPGQCIESISLDEERNVVRITTRRDRRIRPIDAVTGRSGSTNRILRRVIEDLPIAGKRSEVEFEYIEVYISRNNRRVEKLEFTDNKMRVTHRYARYISGLCRHMPVSAVARHTGLHWDTVKRIDRAWLKANLPAARPGLLENLRYIGVDDVARVKGREYVTVVYDLMSGEVIGVSEGRTADTLSGFLSALSEETVAGIEAVAMDMGKAYQAAVKEWLPDADIVFDHFHVMQLATKAVDRVRKSEQRKADEPCQSLYKHIRWLLLRNGETLDEQQVAKLDALFLQAPELHMAWLLKEELRTLWRDASSYESMLEHLQTWCGMAENSGISAFVKLAQSFRKHTQGICNYAKHRLTSASIEAGNVSVGMIRKRARGIRDTEYFRLKVRQVTMPDSSGLSGNLRG